MRLIDIINKRLKVSDKAITDIDNRVYKLFAENTRTQIPQIKIESNRMNERDREIKVHLILLNEVKVSGSFQNRDCHKLACLPLRLCATIST